MLKFAIPAAAALGLIAFAAQSQATNSDTTTAVAPMGWHLSHEGDLAKLAYGVAGSDQLALMMTCAPGQKQAVLYGDVEPVGARYQNAAMRPAAIDPLSGGLDTGVRMSVADPALKQLVRRGKLEVEGDAGAFQLTATREERILIGDFFAYCGNGQA